MSEIRLKSRAKNRRARKKIALKFFLKDFFENSFIKSVEDTSWMPSLKFQDLPSSWLEREIFGRKQKFPYFKRSVAAARDDSRIFLKIEKIS